MSKQGHELSEEALFEEFEGLVRGLIKEVRGASRSEVKQAAKEARAALEDMVSAVTAKTEGAQAVTQQLREALTHLSGREQRVDDALAALKAKAQDLGAIRESARKTAETTEASAKRFTSMETQLNRAVDRAEKQAKSAAFSAQTASVDVIGASEKIEGRLQRVETVVRRLVGLEIFTAVVALLAALGVGFLVVRQLGLLD